MGWRGWAGWAGLAGLQEGGNEAGHMTPVIWGAGCSELQRTGMPEGPQIAPQNGLGWAGLAGLGWAGWLAGLQEGANQRGKSFRTLLLRPAGWGPQPTRFTFVEPSTPSGVEVL